jgi:dihydroxyacetone kinase-like predicted kinase
MDEQHRDFVSAQKARAVATDVAVIAVVAGDGLEEVFTSLGVTAIIQGGQTMNPSAKDILQKVEQTPMDKVIVLPNNKNIILTANQIKPLTQKTVEIIPTKTIPQGVAALLAFDYEADLETNIILMKQSIENIKTIEVTRAVRSTQIGGLKIKEKQIISLLDNELTAVGDDTAEVIMDTLDKIDLEKNEIVTLYYGMDTTRAEAEKVVVAIRDKYPKLQVEIVRGDQPNYHYIISVE